ncbi:MAG: hypothetical protein ACQESL_01795 [Bacteroidota bacterium]
MKYISKISLLLALTAVFLLQACDPNEDLYEKLDEDIPPHSENVTYTLTSTDYSNIGGVIEEYEAFNDTMPAMDYIPDILADRYVTLSYESAADVTFNHLLIHPEWWDAGFGYELTDQDYAFLGIDGAFSPNSPAHQFVPDLLEREYPDAEEEDQVQIIYNYIPNGDMVINEDTYELTDGEWELIETRENVPYVGYEMTPEDYDEFGGDVAAYNNFSEDNPPEVQIPVFLSNKFPMALPDAEKVIKYNYYDGNQMVENIDKFVFDSVKWEMTPYVEERTEQYIYGSEGWAFDPTVIFTMDREDYEYLVEIDPIGQQEFGYDDFAYYYGASAFYQNFDIRIVGRRLDKLENGEYADPELGEIYENEGPDAVMEEMLRRIKEEGLIELLQHKYPDAQPQRGGIDVHFHVRFATFADNWVRRFPEAEYICTEPGDPPQFELVNYIENIE